MAQCGVSACAGGGTCYAALVLPSLKLRTIHMFPASFTALSWRTPLLENGPSGLSKTVQSSTAFFLRAQLKKYY